jgi:thiol:disulfide interchange protein DsbC
MNVMRRWAIAGFGLLAWLTMTSSGSMANDEIRQRMAQVIPDAVPDSITATPAAGWFEVRYGTEILYLSADGRYLMQGNLLDLQSMANLTERTRRAVRAEYFSEIDEAQLTVYRPAGEIRHTLNIFTDPNCPHCRRLHQEMEEYLAAGVQVRYFMFPVLGRQSPEIMRNIWCAEDRAAAMDRAQVGLPVAQQDCATPVEAHMLLARELGINGTPASISQQGQLISGYRPAAEVIQLLNQQERP